MSETKTNEMTKEQLIVALNVANEKLSNARIVKEFSTYFRNKDSEDAKTYKNISETAKHIESRHSEVLDKMKAQNDNKLLTISQFNNNVAKALKEMYA